MIFVCLFAIPCSLQNLSSQTRVELHLETYRLVVFLSLYSMFHCEYSHWCASLCKLDLSKATKSNSPLIHFVIYLEQNPCEIHSSLCFLCSQDSALLNIFSFLNCCFPLYPLLFPVLKIMV